MSSVLDENEKKALTQFERCRVTNGHSVTSFYSTINLRGTPNIPLREFAENLSTYCQITYENALKIAHVFDKHKRTVISEGDINRALNRHGKEITTINNMLQNHPLFPKWLVNREDFQSYFREWVAVNGAPNVLLVETALKNEGKLRKAGDLQIVLKWLKIKGILVHVSDKRLLDVISSIQLMHVPAGANIVTQGEQGDAFYIILEGQLDVFVNGNKVGNLYGGMSFGEKALENNAPRAATVTTTIPCKLMIVRASEYKNLAALAQAKMNQEIVEFLHVTCPLFKSISYARLFYMVKLMVRRTFDIGETVQVQSTRAMCLFVCMRGKVVLRRQIQQERAQQEDMQRRQDARQLRERAKERLQVRRASVLDKKRYDLYIRARKQASVSVTVTHLTAGQVFGEDAALGVGDAPLCSYSVQAVAPTEVIIINRKELLEYFDDKLLPLSVLQTLTRKHRENDFSLVARHEVEVHKQLTLQELKHAAIGPAYFHKVLPQVQLERAIKSERSKGAGTSTAIRAAAGASGKSLGGLGSAGGSNQLLKKEALPGRRKASVSSRGMSTRTLQFRQQRRQSKLAQSEYARIAIANMAKPLDSVGSGRPRRASLVSFLSSHNDFNVEAAIASDRREQQQQQQQQQQQREKRRPSVRRLSRLESRRSSHSATADGRRRSSSARRQSSRLSAFASEMMPAVQERQQPEQEEGVRSRRFAAQYMPFAAPAPETAVETDMQATKAFPQQLLQPKQLPQGRKERRKSLVGSQSLPVLPIISE